MCTLTCWICAHPLAPIVIAANRDERLGRPAREPFLWDSPRILAPRDEQAGGTWWAVNPQGLFVALTNRAGANFGDRRSRGELVVESARKNDLIGIERHFRSLEATDWNGFHLLATDGRTGLLVINDGTSMEIRELGHGFHVVSERSFQAAPVSRDHVVVETMGEGFPDPDALQRLLATHEDDPFQSICVHMEGIDYGTRSSAILALGGTAPLLRFTSGPPCTTPWQDGSEMLRMLLAKNQPSH